MILYMKRSARLLLVASSLLLPLFGFGCDNTAPVESTAEVPETIDLDESGLLLRFIAPSFEHAETYKIPTGAKLYILPHHIVAGKEIAGMLESMPVPKRIILLSPDHFGRNSNLFSTTDKSFAFDNKIAVNDAELAKRLSAVPGMQLSDEILRLEHGVTALLPYIKHALPEASVNAIVISNMLDAEDVAPLVETLRAAVEEPGTIVIASVDMSHYLPIEMAEFHDEYTIDRLHALDIEASDAMEIDAPGVMRTLLTLAKNAGLGQVTIHEHTNSLTILKALVTDESTSHLFANFAPGKAPEPQIETYLFCQPNIETTEDRLYWGQTEVLPPLPNQDDACVGLVTKLGAPAATYIVPLEQKEAGWIFGKKSERENVIVEWGKSGKSKQLDEAAETYYLDNIAN